MKQVFTILILVFSITSFSQKNIELYNDLLQQFNGQQYGEAVSIAEKLLDRTKEKDTLHQHTLTYLSYSKFYLQDYKSAVELAEKEMLLREKYAGKKDERYLGTVYSVAIFYTYIPDLQKAAELMEFSAAGFEELYGTDNDFYLGVLNNLGQTYVSLGDAVKAGDTYYKILKIQERILGRESEVFAEVFENVVNFFYNNGLWDKMELIYLEDVELTKEMFGEKSDQYIISVADLGELYIEAGWYDKALKTFTDYIDICIEAKGQRSGDHATALNNVAVVYEYLGEFDKSEKYHLQSIDIKKEVFKEESDHYARSLCNLASLYYTMGRYQDSEDLYDRAIEIYNKIYGGVHVESAAALQGKASLKANIGRTSEAIELERLAVKLYDDAGLEYTQNYVDAISFLSDFYLRNGELDSAEAYMVETMAYNQHFLGMDHPQYAANMTDMANIRSYQGKNYEAIELLEKALFIFEQVYGKESQEYIRTYHALAGEFSATSQYNKAKRYYRESERMAKKVFGEKDSEYGVFLNNIGYFFLQQGDMDLAESYLMRSLEASQNAHGEGHPTEIYPLQLLAQVYMNKHEFEKAENNFALCTDIAKNVYGEKHPTYISNLTFVGTYYYELGQLDKAERLYKEALEGYENLFGKQHQDYLSGLSNLGALYTQKAYQGTTNEEVQKYVDLANECYSEAILTDSAMGRQDSPDHAIHLNNIAQLYRSYNMIDQGLAIQKLAVGLEERLYGKNSIRVAKTRQNLALIYEDMGRHDEAKDLLQKVLRQLKEGYGPNSPELFDTYLTLATIADKQNDPKEAYSNYNLALGIQLTTINRSISYLTETEKKQYFEANGSLEWYYRFIMDHQGMNIDNMNDIGYNAALNLNGILLRSAEKLQRLIDDAEDPDLSATYNDWIDGKKQLATLFSLEESKRNLSVDSLENVVQKLEKKLVKYSNEFNTADLTNPDWTIIRDALDEGEAAIELIYTNRNDEQGIPQVEVGAFIARHGEEHPRMISMSWGPDFFNLREKNLGTSKEMADALYGLKTESKEEMYNYIWAKLDKELDGIKTVFISKSAFTHMISFDALRNDKGEYISDVYNIRLVNSTSHVPEIKKEDEQSVSKLGVFGGAVYSSDQSETEIWSYLEGTKSEAESIYSLASDSKVECELYVGQDANEHNFKKIASDKQMDILHIATHGFFYSNQTVLQEDTTEKNIEESFRGASSPGQRNFVQNDNPLMRSGLVLSGANDVWNTGDQTNQGEDGVLTAFEVANLNMSETDLVVLSACETGLGDIYGSEGVYGLQRSFRIAGVDKLIMSLWQVPDKETAEFMALLYENLFNGSNIRDAFSKAQKSMRDKYDPYYWAAFVLVE